MSVVVEAVSNVCKDKWCEGMVDMDYGTKLSCFGGEVIDIRSWRSLRCCIGSDMEFMV